MTTRRWTAGLLAAVAAVALVGCTSSKSQEKTLDHATAVALRWIIPMVAHDSPSTVYAYQIPSI